MSLLIVAKVCFAITQVHYHCNFLWLKYSSFSIRFGNKMPSSSFALLLQTFVYVNIIIILSLIDSRVIIPDLNCSLNTFFCMPLFHYSLFGDSIVSLWSLTNPKTKKHFQLLILDRLLPRVNGSAVGSHGNATVIDKHILHDSTPVKTLIRTMNYSA